MKQFVQFLIPVIISIVAVLFNGYQLFVSNKQFLFNKRLKLYLTYKDLLKHQDNVRIYLRDNPDDLLVDNLLIAELTNNSELSAMCNGWMTESALLEDNDHKNFLSMIEKLRIYGEESSFVFNKYGKNLCQYFNKYADLCFKTYKYRIYMKNMKAENNSLHMRGYALSLDTVIEKQLPSHKELIQTYIDLCEISKSIYLSKLAKSISLVRRKR